MEGALGQLCAKERIPVKWPVRIQSFPRHLAQLSIDQSGIRDI
jgi:hypothetical protein